MAYRLILILLFSWTGCAALYSQEHGVASYYSNRLHGKRMSNGARYHRDSLICAHKRYPLGTMLKVTNMKNGKSVVVEVTDRCSGKRIIDLSYAAAKQIGLLAMGVATVRVERYFEFKGIPFKADDNIDMPELDYEYTDGRDAATPQWQESEKRIRTPQHQNLKRNRISKEREPHRTS